MRQILSRIRQRVSGHSPASSEEQAYGRLASRGYRPASIIDVGGYHGDWTRLVRNVFRNVPVLIVEAQPSKAEALRELCSQLPDVTLENSVLAAKSGLAVSFYEMETGSSLMPEQSDVPRREVALVSRTLDEVAKHLTGPIFLKIDVQGAELEVLTGGLQTLQRCDLVQLELAFLPYNAGAPTLLQMLTFMDDHGFVPLDVTNLTRPDHLNLVQADFLFCRPDSILRPTFFHFQSPDGAAPPSSR